MKEGVFTISYPSPIADDGVVRASVTLEAVGGQIYTHNESVWKGLECIGLIFGWKDTNAENDRDAALTAIEGLAAILKEDYGMEISEASEPQEIVPPQEEGGSDE